MKKLPSQQISLRYKNATNELSNLIKIAKFNNEQTLIDNLHSTPRNFFNYASFNSRINDSVITLREQNGTNVTDANDVANVFNNKLF